ncbi:hypothetical protein MHBO_000010 [Bonamia ostreae]|uniref:Uncharacterized protein n=1 Tax=Bonamia ostreae TaxID=126728 RepID=A0ABV2ADZ6_9EUKA
MNRTIQKTILFISTFGARGCQVGSIWEFLKSLKMLVTPKIKDHFLANLIKSDQVQLFCIKGYKKDAENLSETGVQPKEITDFSIIAKNPGKDVLSHLQEVEKKFVVFFRALVELRFDYLEYKVFKIKRRNVWI